MRVSSSEEETDDKEEQDKIDDLIRTRQSLTQNRKQRSSVSAEVYGLYNIKKEFVPKVIAKSDDQKQRLNTKVCQSFMFSALDTKDLNTVLDAMEEVVVKKGDNVITQGDAGDVLFVIEKGEYDCTKIFVSYLLYYNIHLFIFFSQKVQTQHSSKNTYQEILSESLLFYIMLLEQLPLQLHKMESFGL
jgi:hypothetical protein